MEKPTEQQLRREAEKQVKDAKDKAVTIDPVFGELSEAEIDKVVEEVMEQSRPPERAEDIPGVTFDITDDELLLIADIQRQVQNRYAEKPATDANKKAMADELVTRFAEIGFEVVVKWEPKIVYGMTIEVPEVVFISRLERESLMTDHERKRFDALRTEDVSELPNTQLID